MAAVLLVCASLFTVRATTGETPATTEAPAGFDNLTNGLVDQATHDQDRTGFFEEIDTNKSGLGPVFNQTGCANCHSTPVSGGGSQTTERRAGHTDSSGNFVNPTVVIDNGKDVITGRSLINAFAICKQAQETVPETETIQALRVSVNALGDGFVEAIDDSTLLNIAQGQRYQTGGLIHGDAVKVPILEAPGETRVGRFGWKNQHGSLLSFAADAYLNEQGITSRLLPLEVTSVCDKVADPEDATKADGLADIDHFARFLRASKVPPVDTTIASSPDAQAGSVLFDAVGCGFCHIRTLTTAPAGTALNGGTFVVPDALGSKTIHPFSDFLLHDIGTGDGIVQNGGESTANKLRTPPLWGVRMRSKTLMHDGKSTSYYGAIARHAGEAAGVYRRYLGLTTIQRAQLVKFLGSL